MTNPAEWAVRHGRLLTFFVALVVVLGALSYTQLGQLEDPEFTIQTAVVLTHYPGAAASRVEEQVTDPIERYLQHLGEVESIDSYSRNELSVIFVNIHERYNGHRLKQVWDELHRKIAQAAPELPDGVIGPFVNSEFGDVFGIVLALSGDGFTYEELHRIADDVRLELLGVPGVAKVDLLGVQSERIHVEISRAKVASMGITPHLIVQALARQNVVAPSGLVEVDDQRLHLFTTGVLRSVEDITRLVVRSPVTGELVSLGDLADVHRGYAEPPDVLLRHAGAPAIGLAIGPVEGANVVALGEAVSRRVAELTRDLPVGIEIGVIADQPREVRAAVRGFVVSLAVAVVIVLLVLLFSMGLRTGLVIGAGVPLTILGTFTAMWGLGIDLHRVSLGALVIVLGMLVDNSIVVAELTVVKMQRGLDRLRAAREAVAETALPLLSATLIAALAFSPIALTRTAVAEFTRSMFLVVAVSLLISWLLAIYLTPLMTQRFLRPGPAAGPRDPYDAPAYRRLRGWFEALLARRGRTLGGVAALLAIAVAAFGLIPQIFYPPAQRTQFLVDYWLPEGTRLERVLEDVQSIETHLRERDEVSSITAFVGEGAPRFYLPMIPEWRNPAYAQLLVDVDLATRDRLIAELYPWLRDRFPDAEPRVRPLALGMPVRYPVILRIQGPDRGQLRSLAEDAKELLGADPRILSVRDDWRHRTLQPRIEVDQERARRANISSAAVAELLQAALSGAPIGVYHERNRHIPIVWRLPHDERTDPARIGTMPVWPDGGGPAVPLLQVARVATEWDDAMIWRRNRERAISIQADLRSGATAHEVTRDLSAAVAGLPLPPGYRIEWAGEAVEARKAQANVLGPAPVVLGLMALILMFQFNSYRRALIILLTVPLGIIGVSAGLLVLRQPFGFMALLGVMSLSGMIIKNAIVMVEQIDLELARATDPRRALLDAAVSRARPVLLAAFTTVLGMLPLALSGPFWAPMAIAIMSGLAVASVLTLIVVPLLYSALFRIPRA